MVDAARVSFGTPLLYAAIGYRDVKPGANPGRVENCRRKTSHEARISDTAGERDRLDRESPGFVADLLEPDLVDWWLVHFGLRECVSPSAIALPGWSMTVAERAAFVLAELTKRPVAPA